MKIRHFLYLALLSLVGCQSEVIDNSMLVEVEDVSFELDILPIFTVGCDGSECHIGNASVNGINLSTYQNVITSIGEDYNGPAVIAGDAAGSPLVDKLGSQPMFGIQMPDGKPPLSSLEIALIRTWIDEGALDN